MPIQYRGIVHEHESVRSRVGIFDTCHMGEIRVHGPAAVADLEWLLSCDVASLAEGRCRYGMMCNEGGGVIDDLLVYRDGAEDFMLVVNAGTQGGDLAWIRANVSAGTEVVDLSADTAKLDVQGPDSYRLLSNLLECPLGDPGYYTFGWNRFRGERIRVSRTGYTGELGFELYVGNAHVEALWDACIAAGSEPAGLGARDTLRLEVGMPLYGHELARDRNALESGFTRCFSATKDFVGSAELRSGAHRPERLIGIAMEGRQTARAGNAILDVDGKPVGVVTSGSFAPSLQHAVALGYARASLSEGDRVMVETGRRQINGLVATLPFYRHGTARQKLSV